MLPPIGELILLIHLFSMVFLFLSLLGSLAILFLSSKRKDGNTAELKQRYAKFSLILILVSFPFYLPLFANKFGIVLTDVHFTIPFFYMPLRFIILYKKMNLYVFRYEFIYFILSVIWCLIFYFATL